MESFSIHHTLYTDEDFQIVLTENLHGYSQKSFQRSYTPYYTKDYCNNLPKPVNHI